jgi:hypothetical protein
MLETATLIAITVALVEAIKRAFKMSSRFAPLLSITLGVSIAFLFAEGFKTSEIIYTGIVVGLTASGLYSGTKAVIKK